MTSCLQGGSLTLYKKYRVRNRGLRALVPTLLFIYIFTVCLDPIVSQKYMTFAIYYALLNILRYPYLIEPFINCKCCFPLLRIAFEERLSLRSSRRYCRFDGYIYSFWSSRIPIHSPDLDLRREWQRCRAAAQESPARNHMSTLPVNLL